MPFGKNQTLERFVCYNLVTKPRDFSAVAISNFDVEGNARLYFCGIVLVTGRGVSISNYADIVINIYDNNAPDGRHLCPVDMLIPSANSPFAYGFEPPLFCESGHIYVEWATTGNGNYQIIYDI